MSTVHSGHIALLSYLLLFSIIINNLSQGTQETRDQSEVSEDREICLVDLTTGYLAFFVSDSESLQFEVFQKL